jgi:hypothetical protein
LNYVRLRDPTVEPSDDAFVAGTIDDDPSAGVQTKGDTRIPNRVIDHPAFSDLISYAVHLLLLIHHRHRHPGVDRNGNRWSGNNGRIRYSRQELADRGRMDRRTATKALQALVDGNFIKQMREARFNGQEWTAPEWRINYLPCQVTGGSGSFAFKSCKPAVSRGNRA